MLVVLSGKDFVANEFDHVVKGNPIWSRLLADATIKRLEIADHTFSNAEWRDVVANETANWVAHLDRKRADNSTTQSQSDGLSSHR